MTAGSGDTGPRRSGPLRVCRRGPRTADPRIGRTSAAMRGAEDSRLLPNMGDQIYGNQMTLDLTV